MNPYSNSQHSHFGILLVGLVLKMVTSNYILFPFHRCSRQYYEWLASFLPQLATRARAHSVHSEMSKGALSLAVCLPASFDRRPTPQPQSSEGESKPGLALASLWPRFGFALAPRIPYFVFAMRLLAQASRTATATKSFLISNMSTISLVNAYIRWSFSFCLTLPNEN
jgi:hypothetical protein